MTWMEQSEILLELISGERHPIEDADHIHDDGEPLEEIHAIHTDSEGNSINLNYRLEDATEAVHVDGETLLYDFDLSSDDSDDSRVGETDDPVTGD